MSDTVLRGIAAAPGIAIGTVFRYTTQKVVIEHQLRQNTEQELTRLEQARQQAHQEILALSQQARQQTEDSTAAIFEAHALFLDDPELLQQVHTSITQQHLDAAYAWQDATASYIEQLRSLNDDYLAARAADMEDVAQRVLRILQGTESQTHSFSMPVIIVAHDLTPSETMHLDREKVLGFCTAAGGANSHVAILARALGFPAITGLGTKIDHLHHNQQVIVDGSSGEIWIDPDQQQQAHYSQLASTHARLEQEARLHAQLPARTTDGIAIEVVANIGQPGQVAEALAAGAEGIGLLRTEFLFMDRDHAPDENEQEHIYRSILNMLASSDTTDKRPVVIRTFDIGGDKPLPYLTMPTESNPFLGVRGVRLALAQPALFQTQLRALLKAGTGHNLKIMFPMVTSMEEIDLLADQLAQARTALTTQGHEYAQQVEIGIMVEIPAAAIMADILAEHVDFFSIGTNDLAQYTLAGDRGNAGVAELVDALHPAILRLIQMVTRAAHKHGKWVGLCGELASDPLATPVLLGLGIDEWSMNARAIPVIKQNIRQYSIVEARQVAEKVLQLRNAGEVRAYLSQK